jgi:hypothetical protein
LKEKLCPEFTYKFLTDTLLQMRGLVDGIPRVIYIEDYVRQVGKGGKASPVYRIGTKADEPEPTRDRAEALREYNRRYQAKPEVYTERLAYNAARRRKVTQNKRIEKNAAKNAFSHLVSPPTPIVLEAVSVRKVKIDHDEEWITNTEKAIRRRKHSSACGAV